MPTLDVAIKAVRAVAGARQFDEAVKRISTGAAAANSSVVKAQKSFTGLGKGADVLAKRLITLGVAYKGLRFAGASIRAFAEFEDSMAFVSTMLTEQTMHLLPAYEKRIKSMAVQYGQSTKVLTQGTYDILSASFDAADAMEFLDAASRAAVAGFTDTSSVVKALVSILNSYGASAQDARRVTNILAASVQKGVITYDEIATTIGQVAPIAGAAGLSMEQLAAAIASITQKGVNAHMTMTALKSIISTFLQGAPSDPKALAVLEKYNLTLSSTTLASEGLSGALSKLKNATADETAAVFSNLRALLGVEATRKSVLGLIENYNFILNETSLVEANYAKRAGNTAHKLRQNSEAWIQIKENIGRGLAPAIDKALTAVLELHTGQKAVNEELRAFIVETNKYYDGILRINKAETDQANNLLVLLKERKEVYDELAKQPPQLRIQDPFDPKRMKENFDALKELTKQRGDLNDSYKEMFRELEIERDLIGKTTDERERAIKIIELESKLKHKSAIESAAIVDAYKKELEAIKKLDLEAKRKEEREQAFLDELEEGGRNLMRTPLQAMLDESRDIEEVLKDNLARIAEDVLAYMYEETIVNPLMDSIKKGGAKALGEVTDMITDFLGNIAGGIVSGLGGALGGAIGGLFGGSIAGGGAAAGTFGSSIGASGAVSGPFLPAAKGLVTAFDRGGILAEPTIYPMANGGAALAGEAGKEAFMPLGRDSQGRLSVHATGGGDSRPIKIINVMSPDQIQEYLGTGDGERQIINIMRRNKTEISELSG